MSEPDRRSQTMTDRHDDTCLSLICAGASRAEMRLASATIARAADAWCRARAARPRRPRLELVVAIERLRTGDPAATLAHHGLPAARARALAPDLARTFNDETSRTGDPADAWVSFNDVHGVPGAEHAVLLQLAVLAIEVAGALRTPMPGPCARLRIEPLERSPAGPWPGLLATHDAWLAAPELDSRALLAEVRDRLVAHRPGVRAWPPAARAAESTITLRTPEGRPLILVPFVVTDRATRVELEEIILPDVALPGLVHRPCER